MSHLGEYIPFAFNAGGILLAVIDRFAKGHIINGPTTYVAAQVENEVLKTVKIEQTMTLICRGQSAVRGSGGPPPRTRPQDGRGDQLPARTAARSMSPWTCGGEGGRRPAAAIAAEGGRGD